MAPRLSGQTSIVGVVFFVSKSLYRVEKLKKVNSFLESFRAIYYDSIEL